MKQEKGITLIALVITIIILIILAGVSISVIMGDEGLIERTKTAKEESTIKSIEEKLELVKGSDYVNEVGQSNIDTYFVTLEKEKIEPYEISEKNKINDSLGYVIADGKYSFMIKIENNNNISVEYEGQKDDVDRNEPVIEVSLSGDKQQTSMPISLSATVTRNGENSNQEKWTLNTSSEELGTEESKYENNVTDGTINLQINEDNTYYLHVLTSYSYERKKETIKGPITVETKYHVHTGNSSSGGECYGNKVTNPIYGTCIHKFNRTIMDSQTQDTAYHAGSICGQTLRLHGISYSDYQHRVQTGSSTSYSLNCGKTETTVEGYNISY